MTRATIEYIPAPAKNPVRLGASSPGRTACVRSTSGWGTFTDHRTQQRTTASPLKPTTSVGHDVQPHVFARLIASRTPETPTASSSAPRRSSGGDTRRADAGSTTAATPIARAHTTAPSQ